jgi:hypothetical protein
MPNNLLEKLKISFREDFSFKICNDYDARSKQNGLIMIYKIYLKSFMIFNHLEMCCFGFTKISNIHMSSLSKCCGPRQTSSQNCWTPQTCLPSPAIPLPCPPRAPSRGPLPRGSRTDRAVHSVPAKPAEPPSSLSPVPPSPRFFSWRAAPPARLARRRQQAQARQP